MEGKNRNKYDLSSFFATMFDEKLVINEIFLQGMMNSGHKGSKEFVHKGPFFHPTSTRVFWGPACPHTSLPSPQLLYHPLVSSLSSRLSSLINEVSSRDQFFSCSSNVFIRGPRTPEYSRRAGMKILNISAFFFCDVSFKLVIFRYF